MPLGAFCDLADVLRPRLSRLGVPPDARTAIALRHFGGGRYFDIGAALGVHSASVYRALWAVILLIPRFCPHRQRTGVQQECMDVSDWPRGSTAVHVGSHLYRMCPYGPQTHNRLTPFSEII